MVVAVSQQLVSHLIDGVEVPSASGRTFASVNPGTGEEIAQVAFGEPEDIDRAVAAAWRAFDSGVWSHKAPGERARILRRVGDLIRDRADEIGAVESRDTGKPLAQAVEEVAFAGDLFTFFAGLAELPDGHTHPADAGYFVYSRRVPHGVVGAISPWNYPFQIACGKVAPALALGNSVVFKMAEQTPLSTAYLARLCLEAGVPAGVFNVVHGDGETTGAALVAHPRIPKISFTGSTAVGREILRVSAQFIRSVDLELGGKTPNIVFADADLDQAVAGSLFTSFSNAGQICTSGSRLLVQANRRDEVVDALVERARAIPVGDPSNPATKIGPLVSAVQLERVNGYIETGRRGGARLALGGGRPRGVGPSGYFVEPTIFTDVTLGMRIAQEEIFGPVLSVMTFETEEEALKIANGVMYGLAAGIWTNDLGRAFRMAERLDAGIVWTNCPLYQPVNVPIEGHKMSGLGEDYGVEIAHSYTHLKTHAINFGGAKLDWA